MTASSQLIDMAMGYWRSRVICAAARLGVADALGDREHSVEELAAACQSDPDALYRLLRALASLGITAETTPRRFILAPLGQPLRKDVPYSAWAGVVFWADLLADSWSHLTDCVRTGQPAAAVMERAGIASRWSQTPDSGANFRAVMGTSPVEDYMPIASRCEIPENAVVADLGGGGGSLIAALLAIHPHIQGMLVDRPESIEAARPRFAPELAPRCTLIAADLRTHVPPGADVYLLKHVLHGFEDLGAVEVLRHCRESLPAHGRLFVIEFLLPDVISQPDGKLQGRFMSDLNMLAVTGGRERSAFEWTRLLESARFAIHGIVHVPELDVHILEAVPTHANPTAR